MEVSDFKSLIRKDIRNEYGSEQLFSSGVGRFWTFHLRIKVFDTPAVALRSEGKFTIITHLNVKVLTENSRILANNGLRNNVFRYLSDSDVNSRKRAKKVEDHVHRSDKIKQNRNNRNFIENDQKTAPSTENPKQTNESGW